MTLFFFSHENFGRVQLGAEKRAQFFIVLEKVDYCESFGAVQLLLLDLICPQKTLNKRRKAHEC